MSYIYTEKRCPPGYVPTPYGECVEAVVSLRGAGDYDEELHPRDEKGRFASKEGGDAPQEVPIEDVRASAMDALRARGIERPSRTLVANMYPDGSRAFDFGSYGRPGSVRAVFEGSWPGTDAQRTEALEQIATLRTADPLGGPVEVVFGSLTDAKGEYLRDVDRGDVIAISPSGIAYDDKARERLADNGPMTDLQGTITHEYGHALAESKYREYREARPSEREIAQGRMRHEEVTMPPDPGIMSKQLLDLPATSVYGEANYQEKYAEAYVTWRAGLAEMDEPLSLPRELARIDGWGAP